jgi:tetratricopeptide (TPR) repeat protein
MQNLARVFRSQGRFDEADAALAKVVGARQRLLGAENPLTLSALTDLGALSGARGDYKKAATVLAGTLETLRRVSGKEGAQTLTALENLAEADRLQGRLAEASESLTALLEARRRTAGDESPLTTSALVALGRLYVQQRKFRDAETLLRAAFKNLEKTAPDSWRRFQCSSLLGAGLAGLGQYADAEALLLSGYEGMLQRQTTIPAEDRAALEWTRQSLVQLYQATRSPEKAAEWSRKLTHTGT